MGPKRAEAPLWRTGENGTKLYVEVRLSDGQPRLFLVDTGASLSVLHESVLDELGLRAEARRGEVVGLSGRVPWRSSTVPELQLAGYTLHNVDFAVGVPGIPQRAGFAPVAGVLGNNVWQQFLVAIDYPSNTLELWRPEYAPEEPGTHPMAFNGMHVRVEAELHATRGEQRVVETVWLEVDTGAGGLLLAGPHPGPLESVASEGLEPIIGVGAGDNLPLQDFLRQTRRLEIEEIRVGGVLLEEDLSASWINYDVGASPVGPSGLPGLLGHQVMDQHRIIVDFQRRRFGVLPPQRDPKVRDVHTWALDHLKRPRSAQDHVERAKPLAALDRLDDAEAALRRALSEAPGHPEASVFLARVLRVQGDDDGAIAALAGLPASDLVEHGELVGAVNALWLAGLPDEGLRLARSAAATRPGQASAWVALSDAHRFSGDLPAARRALQEAARLEENPDAHLLRRAWLAADEGDVHGAMTHLRRLMSLHPAGNLAPWMYAHLALSDQERGLLREDLSGARARLHPGDGPLDYFAGALSRIGESDLSIRVMEEGLERDCDPDGALPASLANCEAWYRAMARHDLIGARERIDRARATEPHRSDFLDTAAVVHEAQGELAAARDAAWAAARQEPDNLYFLWQAARLDAALRGTES